ncbi:MAG: hypothetical protein AAB588_04580 [Patescibacteria group bacterium]
MLKKILLLTGISLAINGVLVRAAAAHCPLCTLGAGAAALTASWLGVSSFSVGIFIGAFGLAVGLWMGGLLKKKINIFPYQTTLIGVISFITTVWPLKSFFYDNTPLYISLFGDYGSYFNRTYYVDKFIVGSVLGAAILWITPSLSKKLSSARNGKTFPYQGIIICFLLLTLSALLFEILA